MDFSLDPQRRAWRVAATFKLTPAMLACLEGQPGRATVTTSASGDKVLRVGDNSFTFTSHPDVPADLVRGGAFDARPGTSVEPAPRARVAASLRCHLKHKRPLTGTNGVAASVKRRFEQADGDRRARKAVVVDYIAPEPRETRRRNRRGETTAGDASTSAAKPPRRVIRAPSVAETPPSVAAYLRASRGARRRRRSRRQQPRRQSTPRRASRHPQRAPAHLRRRARRRHRRSRRREPSLFRRGARWRRL